MVLLHEDVYNYPHAWLKYFANKLYLEFFDKPFQRL